MTRDAFGRYSDEELLHARSVRKLCDDCGSYSIEIGRWSDVRDRINDNEADRMVEGFELLGLEPIDDPVGWVCLRCGNVGVFGPWQHSEDIRFGGMHPDFG